MNGGLFGAFLGAGNRAPAPAPAGQQLPAGQQQQLPQPTGQQQQQQQLPAGNQPPAGQQQQTQQTQQTQQQPNQSQGLDLVSLFGLGQQQQQPQAGQQLTPEQLAQSAFAALTSGQPLQNPTSAPAINMERLAPQLASMDFTRGVDLNAALGLNLDEAGQTQLRSAMNSMQMQTIATMVPLVNALVSQTMQTTMQTAQQNFARDNTAESIIQTFVQQAPFGGNPVIRPVVASLANLIAQQAPRGVDPKQAAQAIQQVLSVFGTAIVPQQGQFPGPQSAQTDMTNIFR